MNKLKVAFFGTPQFSTGVLESLHNNPNVIVKCVVTGVDKKIGRGQKVKATPVADFTEKNNIFTFKTANINDEINKVDELNDCDLYIVVAFSQFLSSTVLNKPQLGCFNIHTSLLPKYRGAAPIQYALLNGDKETGICIQRMVKKMDAGDIAHQRMVSIDEKETSESLFIKLENESKSFINEFVEKIINNDINYVKQDEQKVSFAPTIKKADGHINFALETSTNIINKTKAFHPWPGTYFFINNLRIKIHQVEIASKHIEPGSIDIGMNTLSIGTKEGSLRIKTLQLEGKKPIQDFEFINGHKIKFDHFIITQEEIK